MGILKNIINGIGSLAGRATGTLKGLLSTDYTPYDDRLNRENQGSGYDYKDGGGTEAYNAFVKAGNIGGVFGMPFQFLPSVDPRYTEEELNLAKETDPKAWKDLIYKDNTTVSAVQMDDGSWAVENFEKNVANPLEKTSGINVEATNVNGQSKMLKGIGRMYGSKIITKAPLLFLIPCNPSFMEDSSSRQKKKVLDALGKGNLSSKFKGKYYTTKYAYSEYSKCVNTMVRLAAYNAGVADANIYFDSESTGGEDGTRPLREYDTTFSINKGLEQYIGSYGQSKQAVTFYVDGGEVNSLTETMSNSSTDSSLAQSMSGYSQQANEIIFLLGEDSGVKALKSVRDQISGGATMNFNMGGTSGIMSDLSKNGISTILHGGKLLFPKIWSDSNFSRSYNFTIKLRCPYHDNYSIFLDIIIPLIHLIALVLPRSLHKDGKGSQENPNAYKAPFLVRAYMKGLFNIDMGLITDMTITRGAECQWNDDGLPTQVDVTMSIEDLYQTMKMTDPYKDDGGFSISLGAASAIVSNDAMVDYLANLCGLSVIAQPGDYEKQARYAKYLTGATWAHPAANLKKDWENLVNNTIRNWSNIN